MNTKLTITLGAGIALASQFLNTATAQDLTSKLANVSIVSVDRMSLTNTGPAYALAVDITFQNLNAESFKFRSADLAATLRSEHPEGTNIVTVQVGLGNSHLNDLVLPAGSAAHPGTVMATAYVELGPTGDPTNAKLLQLFNAVSDPTNSVSLLLHGSSELGLKLPHGWMFEQGKRFEVDLSFMPTIQRSVLLN
jgi:hypothetical protein